MALPAMAIQHAVLLNNHGVSLLFQGSNDEAMVCLLRAVRKVRDELVDGICEEGTDFSACNARIHAVSASGSDKSDYLYCYNNTFHIVLNEQNFQLSSVAGKRELVAVIMFNLARLFHTKACAGCSECETKATRLYELVLQSLPMTLTDSVVTSQLRAVVLNNLGVLLHFQNRTDAAASCFLSLLGQLRCYDIGALSAYRREMISNCFFVLVQEGLGATVCAKAA